ncbi:replication factor C small subunit, partial [archaeon]|nr:replication factor C small subunit [archaeon]
PAGTGKTSLILVISRKLYGNQINQNFLELNASDERGIDVVRNTIKDFARTKAIGDVPFKLIYLDECDSLTKEAQQALRRTMENYAHSTRFCLSCNYSSKIIEPIQSRCSLFRFKPLSMEDIFSVIDDISGKEGLKVKEDVKKILYQISEGDVRRLQNIMQSCSVVSKDITEELIYEIVSEAKPKEMKEIIDLSVKGDFIKARDKILNLMLHHGLNSLELIKQIQKDIWYLEISDERKLKMIEKCGEIEFRLTEGSDEFVQIEALLASFALK